MPQQTCRQKRLRNRSIRNAILSLLLTTLTVVLCAGCSTLIDPSASLSGSNKTAYNCIVNSSYFSDYRSISISTGRVIGSTLYCGLSGYNSSGRYVSYDLYKITESGYTSSVAITYKNLDTADYCLAKGYLNTTAINEALEKRQGSKSSSSSSTFTLTGGNGNMVVYIIVLVGVLILNGFLASNASDIAADKGYPKRKWFHMCFWLGIFGYLLVIAMPDLNLRNTLEQTNKLLSGNNPEAPKKITGTSKPDSRPIFNDDLPSL